MRSLSRRIEVLEQTGAADIAPAVKAWLGWSLTEAEQQALAEAEDRPVDRDNIDTRNLSKEVREWLGIS